MSVVFPQPILVLAQDVATIAAEVSVAAAVQASKEFWHMREPKVTKLHAVDIPLKLNKS